MDNIIQDLDINKENIMYFFLYMALVILIGMLTFDLKITTAVLLFILALIVYLLVPDYLLLGYSIAIPFIFNIQKYFFPVLFYAFIAVSFFKGIIYLLNLIIQQLKTRDNFDFKLDFKLLDSIIIYVAVILLAFFLNIIIYQDFSFSGLFSLANELLLVAVFLGSLVLIKSRGNLLSFFRAQIIISSLISILISLFYLRYGISYQNRLILRGLIKSWPNYYSMYLVVTVLFTISFIIFYKKGRWVMSLALFPQLAVLIISQSRTAYGMLFLSTLYLVIVFLRGRTRLISMGLVIIFIIGFIMLPPVTERIKMTIDQEYNLGIDNSSYERILRAQIALKAILERPLLGFAQRSIADINPAFYNPNSGLEQVMGSAHNDFLDRTVRSGLLGLLAWVYFVILLLKRTLYFGQKQQDGGIRAISIGIHLSIIALLIASFFQQPFRYYQFGALLWAFAGIMLKFYSFNRQSTQV